MPWGTKNMPPKKNLSRGSLSNWCDADADADISKTICRPPPYGPLVVFAGTPPNPLPPRGNLSRDHARLSYFFEGRYLRDRAD